ncbi:BREX-1 system adenine-specific DNA-methyltransferase PglX [Synechococcus sp. UW140]|uniref:BREX-1 system adenine-specific DNA-methyltransferase PglX n=1 Tax=Synechococcus sp. UW140 TaxID=368503 RepID=UPI003137F28F
MPVNTAALKTFAPAMRRQLLEAVGRKLDLLLNSQTPDTLSTFAKQIAELREQEAENREQLLERVAYTWFNRLCALRYLDARGWHPFGCKVLMPAAEDETQPELLKLTRAGNLPSSLQSHTDQDRLHGLLDGQIPTAITGADSQGEVYRQLVLAVCRCYHELLPNLFEGLDDASELLLPDDVLSDGSIVGAFRKEINDDDCQDVESLGWLYQFYIAEKKDEVMARKKAVPTEDIPAVTQLFTPHWIVRYLVENSLGRLWLLNRPGSKLRDQMPYYIEGDGETDFLVINKPEEIKLLDPACGSGHMLTYAFDLLVLIYEEEGYSPNEIPGLILKHNLHGLEICPRAAQLAELALVFKAREQSRRFFQPEQLVRPQIIELQDVHFAEGELNDYIEVLDLDELFDPNLFKLLHQFEEAKNFGSLIRPCLDERAIADVQRAIEAKDICRQLFLREIHRKVLSALEQAKVLARRHHVVVANPPYSGSRYMNNQLSIFAKSQYGDSKADMFSMFVERMQDLAEGNGCLAVVCPYVWMYLSAYEGFRKKLLKKGSICSLVRLEYNAFEPACVPVAAWIFSKNTQHYSPGAFIDLSEFVGFQNQAPRLLDAIRDPAIHYRSSYKTSDSDAIPGSPIAYQTSQSFRDSFNLDNSLGDIVVFTGSQNVTGDNGRFVRFFWEPSKCSVGRDERWIFYAKGGGQKKWYGLNQTIIDWGLPARQFYKNNKTSNLISQDYWFREGITYSELTSGINTFRVLPPHGVYDKKGPSFHSDESTLRLLLLLCNSVYAANVFSILNPTMSLQVHDVKKLPIPPLANEQRTLLESVYSELVGIARADWDNFETSWDFDDLPLLRPALKGQALAERWQNLDEQCSAAIRRTQELETENNRFLIAAYGLDSELQPVVPEEQITLARAEVRKDMAAFLSYATGCMMGRYSLDLPGLILADSRDSQAEQLAAYEEIVGKPIAEVQFKPDPDGIVPVLDGEWFEDDIVARTREFLTVTFPESTVTENLRFIEESLGKDIRKYFCSDFYKDHLQTYKKRPIYWLVQSPKKGFACLVYLHRYTKDTLNLVLNNYFRPYLQKLEARLAQLGLDQLNDDLPTRERTAARKEAEKITKVLKECQAWEQDALLPLAQQRIELDLDDGVKVNYLKLQDVLAPIPGLIAKED